MNKHIKTYGYLFIYLGFTFGLDRIYAYIRMSYAEDINNNVGFILINIYWILFAIGSFVFLYNSIIKNNNDKMFFNLQSMIGTYGALYPIFSRNRYSLFFPYEHTVLLFIHGSQLGALTVAFIFVGGLGVMGLAKIKREEKDV